MPKNIVFVEGQDAYEPQRLEIGLVKLVVCGFEAWVVALGQVRRQRFTHVYKP